MPAKQPQPGPPGVNDSPAFRIIAALGLGLSLTACGPIAFQDTVNFSEPKAAPALGSEKPDESRPAARKTHATIDGDHIVIDEMIQFEYDSAEIKSESHEILDDVVKLMTANPRIEQVDIIGHTSSEGSVKHNNKLSTDRAASVRQYLIDHGIDSGRLSSQGKGPSQPIADNATEEGKIANRRVEFKIMKMNSGEAQTGGARGRPGK
jgi:outer membrane protein OmpA-like peptidoglycan-associated protein